MIGGLHWIDWLILLIPLGGILYLAVHARKYVHGIADFLAAGRVAGRYLISVGDMTAGLSVITLVAFCENEYRAGMAMGFWNRMIIPLSLFLSLTGFVLYRWRQVRCLSSGQFFEMRYSRPFRVVAAVIRTFAEAVTNAIGPAVAARFFIYFLGLPFYFEFLGIQCSTYAAMMLLVLSLALLVVWTGGRVSLLVTDAIQGLMSYPIFVIITVFIMTEISWDADVAPVMLDRAPGESFLNPMDIDSLRDFNLFALIVHLVATVLNRGAWIGNDTSNSGRTAHEQKMARILGTWRNGFSQLMIAMVGLFIVSVMLGGRFAEKARKIRQDTVRQVANETVKDPQVRDFIIKETELIPAARHKIGKDAPYSQAELPDNPYLDVVKKALLDEAERKISAMKNNNLTDEQREKEAQAITGAANRNIQEFRTIYHQCMMPVLLRNELPVGVIGAFLLLAVMLLISTDDSRIFNASSTLVQDVVMPFRKKPFEKAEHFRWLRGMSLAVAGFFFIVSLFFAQLDYINMFISIMTAVWMGASGPIMLGGLYTRWGTTCGAWCALIFGSGTALSGLAAQRTWSTHIYPFLQRMDWLPYVDGFYKWVNSLLSPYIVWDLNPIKFAPNSYEIYFTAMVLGCIAYTVGSLISYREPFNLDRMLHQGAYGDETSSKIVKTKWTWGNFISKVVGITSEYTLGDKVIAWSVFIWSLVIGFGFLFIGVLVWDAVSPWTPQMWSDYFFITVVVMGLIVGVVSTFWFLWGGIRDLRQLFRDLAARADNQLDNGWVEGHVAAVDRNRFDELDKQQGIVSTVLVSRPAEKEK